METQREPHWKAIAFTLALAEFQNRQRAGLEREIRDALGFDEEEFTDSEVGEAFADTVAEVSPYGFLWHVHGLDCEIPSEVEDQLLMATQKQNFLLHGLGDLPEVCKRLIEPCLEKTPA
ncbi:MAG: hypothetical protein ACE361_19390 [Aureliella sp.]